MATRSRSWLVTLGLAAALVLGGAAGAQDTPLRGAGLVQTKDLEARTLVVNGTTYRVTEQTALEGIDGGFVTLEDLRAAGADQAILDPREVDGVWFEAVNVGGQLVLERLRVLRSLPR